MHLFAFPSRSAPIPLYSAIKCLLISGIVSPLNIGRWSDFGTICLSDQVRIIERTCTEKEARLQAGKEMIGAARKRTVALPSYHYVLLGRTPYARHP
jgi:hypothetical protein